MLYVISNASAVTPASRGGNLRKQLLFRPT
jgi:hypothetical protein